MPLDPNPESYPPYAGQSYVKVHQMNLYGMTVSGYVVQTLRSWEWKQNALTQAWEYVDTYPAGQDYTEKAKYHVNDGQLGLVWVKDTSTPYVRTSKGVGVPLAFSTAAAATSAISNLPSASAVGYNFWGRNPRFEIAQALDAYKQNAEEFAAVDLQVSGSLSSRNVTNAQAFYDFVASKVVNQDSNQQYVLGLSAASGGGQNTTYIANSISAAQLQSMAEQAIKFAADVPVTTPFESPLIAESHAQAVEAKNAGEIRDQQIRQALGSAQGVTDGLELAFSKGYTWDGTSIIVGAYGQLGAAKQT